MNKEEDDSAVVRAGRPRQLAEGVPLSAAIEFFRTRVDCRDTMFSTTTRRRFVQVAQLMNG